MTKVTVLTPIYNAEKYLRKCLDSLVSQSLKECQFICIDDCSTDQSADIVREYAERDERFRLICLPENAGPIKAKNVGLQYAEGEYITMLDADDWYDSDSLELAYNKIKSTAACDCAVFRLIMYQQEDGSEHPFVMAGCPCVMTGQEAFRLSLDWTLHGLYLLHRDIQLKYLYDETCRQFSGDNTTRIHYLHSRRVALCEGKYYYRQHRESISHVFSLRRFLFMDAYSSMKAQIIREAEAGNIDNPTEILTRFENLRWHNYLSMVRYYLENESRMSTTERRDICCRLADKLHGFETDKIEPHLKHRFGYIPLRSWPLFLAQVRIFHMLFPLYSTLKKFVSKPGVEHR